MKSTAESGAREKVREVVRQTNVDMLSPDGIELTAAPVPPFTSPATVSSVSPEAQVEVPRNGVMSTSSRVVVPVPFHVIVPLPLTRVVIGNVPFAPVFARSVHFPIFPDVAVSEPLNFEHVTEPTIGLVAADAVPAIAKLSDETDNASRADAISTLRTGTPIFFAVVALTTDQGPEYPSVDKSKRLR